MLLLDFCSAAVVKALYVVVFSRVFCSAAAFIFVIYVASNDVIAPAAAVKVFLFPQVEDQKAQELIKLALSRLCHLV